MLVGAVMCMGSAQCIVHTHTHTHTQGKLDAANNQILQLQATLRAEQRVVSNLTHSLQTGVLYCSWYCTNHLVVFHHCQVVSHWPIIAK